MSCYNLCLLGFGNVGRALAELLVKKDEEMREEFGIEWRITGVATRRMGWLASPEGFDLVKLLAGDVVANVEPQPYGVREWLKAARADVLFETTSLNHLTGRPAIDYLRISNLPFEARRKRLESFVASLNTTRVDLSPLVPFTTWEELTAARADPNTLISRRNQARSVLISLLVAGQEAGHVRAGAQPYRLGGELIPALSGFEQRRIQIAGRMHDRQVTAGRHGGCQPRHDRVRRFVVDEVQQVHHHDRDRLAEI